MTVGTACVTAVLLHAAGAWAAPPDSSDTMNNIPQELSSGGRSEPSLAAAFSGERGREVQGCARKCVATCIRGGGGAPGLGPLALRKEPTVFKETFRSRGYCLGECTQLCSLSVRGEAGVGG
ncbi:hypothetical protein WJX81_002694 [Elliptochloris bilobata]|uniref:Uncharacterized protein n=1 Tax=Elliptochloris bilobata TaxID=381761 RepID=A0AAW1S9A1_9CHLO